MNYKKLKMKMKIIIKNIIQIIIINILLFRIIILEIVIQNWKKKLIIIMKKN